MKGNRARAILIVVYGNRAYDDTFAERQDVLEDSGFCCTAAVAAVAEHSIMRQFVAGRPDGEDEKELARFAADVRSVRSRLTTPPRQIQKNVFPVCAVWLYVRKKPAVSARFCSPQAA